MWRQGVIAASLGALGVAVTAAGSWVPSFWGDEAASVLSAERGLPSLFRMLGHVDAVHGTYYLLLHFWIVLFGASEFSTRLPSAIAVGIAVAGVFVLGDVLVSRTSGLIAAVICAVLPSMSFFGGEARSYAAATAIAVWLGVLLVEGVRRPSHPVSLWIAYGLLLALGIWVFLYLCLLVPAHASYVLCRRPFRRSLRRWTVAVVGALVLTIPLLVTGYEQRGQVSFLSHRRHLNWRSILVYQWLGNGYLAIVVWALILVALAWAIVLWRRHRPGTVGSGQAWSLGELTRLALPWLVIPSIALGVISLVTPTYDIRYVSFAAPAIALLTAAGISRLPRFALRTAAAAVVIALALPTDIGQRGPNAYNSSSDWSRVAAVIGSRAHPGDAVVFDATSRPSQRPRLVMRLYPAGFAGLRDVELKTPFYERSMLWDSTVPVGQVASRLEGVHTVWLLQLANTVGTDAGTSVRALRSDGYTARLVAVVDRMQVYRLSRNS